MKELVPAQIPQLLEVALPGMSIDQICRQTGAMRRTRVVKSATELLELCLIHGLSVGSLRTTAAIFSGCHRPISDVGVLKRLNNAAPFLRELLRRMLVPDEFQHRAVDATVLVSPGGTTSDWRMHAVLGLAADGVQPVAFELTAGAGPDSAEHLMRAPHPPGAVLLGDRGLSSVKQLHAAVTAGHHVLVRVSLGQLAWYAPDGDRVPAERLIAESRGLTPGGCREWPIEVQTREGERVRLRLIACRLSPSAAKRELRKSERVASRKGHRKPRGITRAQSEWLWIVTSLPTTTYSAADAAMLYRLRWQIELYFKHLKSDLAMDKLRAKQPAQVATWVLSKLLLAVLVDRFRDLVFPHQRARVSPP